MPDNTNPKVEYDVKELLDKLGDQITSSAQDIKAEVARLAAEIQSKASAESVSALAKTVADLDLRLSGRINTIEAGQGESRGFSKGTMAIIAVAVPAFVVLLVAAINLLAGVHPG